MKMLLFEIFWMHGVQTFGCNMNILFVWLNKTLHYFQSHVSFDLPTQICFPSRRVGDAADKNISF